MDIWELAAPVVVFAAFLKHLLLYVQQTQFILNRSRFIRNLIFQADIDFSEFRSLVEHSSCNSFPMQSDPGRIAVCCELFPLWKGKFYGLNL